MATPHPIPESGDSHEADPSSAGDEEPNVVVESLVAGRAKRITAGNRLSSLLAEEDDELELLFAEEEGEEDVEFGTDETDGASDVPLDSSTDEEDHDAGKEDDGLEGERELQQQDRTEREKKRKARDVFKRPSGLRKRTIIDPTSNTALSRAVAARAKKKSDRVSWVSTPGDGPTRSSTRKQTVQNKRSVHQRMIEGEKRRVQLIQAMEEAVKRKEASKPKRLTQAERMEEAARTEERNAKSLNRWEETEKKRSDEQKAKLEALHNRHLSGPVITWWSGMASWTHGRLTHVGGREAKGAHHDGLIDAGGAGHPHAAAHPQHDPVRVTEKIISPSRSAVSRKDDRSSPPTAPLHQSAAASRRNEEIDGVRGSHAVSGASPRSQPSKRGRKPHGIGGSLINARNTEAPPPPSFSNPFLVRHPERFPADESGGAVPAATVERSTRNLVILRNIDANDLRLSPLQNPPLLKKRNGKPSRKWTGHPVAAMNPLCSHS